MATKLEINTTSLQELLDAVNALPDASINIPELTVPATNAEVLIGKEYIDADGNAQTGSMPDNGKIAGTIDGLDVKTFAIPEGRTTGGSVSLDNTIDDIVVGQADLLAQIQEALEGKAAGAEPELQEKTVSPTTSSQVVTPDNGYDGLSQVTVNAMTTATQATPSITVSTGGLITASATQTAGYVSAGTKSATKQLTVQAAQTITPGTSNKTISSGTYLTGTQTIKGDANLAAANIKKGVSIFGVSGSYAGGSGLPSGVSKLATGTVTYSANKTSPVMISHGLGVVPNFAIVMLCDSPTTSVSNLMLAYSAYHLTNAESKVSLASRTYYNASGSITDTYNSSTTGFSSSSFDLYLSSSTGAALAGYTYRWVCGVMDDVL